MWLRLVTSADLDENEDETTLISSIIGDVQQ